MNLFPVLFPVGFPVAVDAFVGVPGVVAKGVVGANAKGQWTALLESVVILWGHWVTECAKSTNNEGCIIVLFSIYG